MAAYLHDNIPKEKTRVNLANGMGASSCTPQYNYINN